MMDLLDRAYVYKDGALRVVFNTSVRLTQNSGCILEVLWLQIMN